MNPKTFYFVFLLLSHLSYSQNKTYYISASGNDVNSGLSTATAWQTLTNINNIDLEPGDKILLEGGSIFTGSIQLDQNDNGTTANPVLISSYGTGRATIYAPNTNALYASNVGGIKVSNLVFQGNNSNTNGLYFEITQTSSDIDYIYIDNVEAFNFNCRGMLIGAHSTDKGFNNVTILHSNFHNNGIAGMETFGNTAMFSHTNFTIAYCKFYDNYGTLDLSSMSGNGLIVSGIDGALVEYCEAYNNGDYNRGPGGGPVGIWTYDTKNVIIQHCESHHNKAGWIRDGGGFDLDGGSQNCIIQYCYSHDNEGPGLLMVEFGSLLEFTNNILRYNISQNDGRKNSYGALGFYAVDGSHQIKNSKVYNNTVYVDAQNLINGLPSAVKVDSHNFSNVQISNNIFYITSGVDMLTSSYPLATNELHFLDNNYFSAVSDYHFKWNGTDYTSLTDWRLAATGQEMNGPASMGITANPLLLDAGSAGTVHPADGGNLKSLFGYSLYSSSPLINQGIDLLDGVALDFFGNTIPHSLQYDIGASEYMLSAALPLTISDFTAVVQTNSVSLQWKANNEETVLNYEVLKSQDGIRFNKVGTVISQQSAKYSFNDDVKAGNAFYRIKYVCADGKSGISSTLKVSGQSIKDVSAFYSQGQGMQVRILTSEKTIASIFIFSADGKLVSNTQHRLEKGSNNFLVSEKIQWKPGIYFVTVTTPGMKGQVARFTKP